MTRDVLADYVGRRVDCTAFYDYSNEYMPHNARPIKTTLVQDCVVSIDGKDLEIGHTWVQQSNEILAVRPMRGTKIKFKARVSQYMKRLTACNSEGLMSELRYGLTNPSDVTADEMDDTPPPVYVPPPPPDPLDLLRQTRELTRELCCDQLAAVLPHLPRITELAQRAGGADRLAELLKLLS